MTAHPSQKYRHQNTLLPLQQYQDTGDEPENEVAQGQLEL